jgi:hypothetical protein
LSVKINVTVKSEPTRLQIVEDTVAPSPTKITAAKRVRLKPDASPSGIRKKPRNGTRGTATETPR